MKKRRLNKRRILMGLVVLLVLVGAYNAKRPLPDNVSVMGDELLVPADSVSFFADRTYVDADGVRHKDHQIFDEVFSMIEEAQEYILVDMFLYNDFQGDPPETFRELSQKLTDALVEKKHSNPDMVITVVSDPINTIYGGIVSKDFEQLEEAEIPVVITDVRALRDSNPIYSAMWRVFFQWFGNTANAGIMPNPFQAEGDSITLRSWLSLLNFKANHRKVVVADSGEKLSSIIMSANPHDGSSAHGNIAVRVDDMLWGDVVITEQAVGEFSGKEVPGFEGRVNDEEGDVVVQLLTEGAIRDRIVELVDETQEGDTIDVFMFYLSDRPIVRSLIRAAHRDVTIRLVLDPNKDAFGRTKNGIPNRQVAHELVSQGGENVQVQWCHTHGEQCHSKMVLLRTGDTDTLIAGSANLTRRNIGDYNLETNVLVSSDEDIAALSDARAYFEEVWGNEDGRIYTADYDMYEETGMFKSALYRIQEVTGLSSF